MRGTPVPSLHIPASVVGITTGPREHAVDARWLMAYAAALGETAPEYLDTSRPGGLLAHPLFPVCYEWPLALDVRAKALPDEVALRGVHATHRLTVHRPIRAGDRLSTTATVATLEPRAPGAYMVLRLETADAAGRPVTTTDYGSLYLGISCDPSPSPSPPPLSLERRGQGEGAPEPPGPPAWTTEVAISPTLAHVYTECARIWNPIHTDLAYARAAGLPGIILHGTATLALTVSKLLARYGIEPRSARRVRCRFSGMVLMPTTLEVHAVREGAALAFETRNPRGEPVITRGELLLQ